MSRLIPNLPQRFLIILFTGIASLMSDAAFCQTNVDIIASKDNTLYQQANGGISNGSGQFLFAGRTSSSGELRRGLIYFSLENIIPAGARIDSAVVTLHMSKSVSGLNNVGLHQMSAEWGESTSDAPTEEGQGAPAATGDATWTHRIHSTLTWSTAGGSFDSESDANRSVSNTGFYSWRGLTLTATVKGWRDNPATNFGWAILGNEQATSRTTKRFDSRENSVAINRPRLRVYFSIGVRTEDLGQIPSGLSNLETYPNPAQNQLSVRFQSAISENIELDIFDLLGRRVSSLLTRPMMAGPQEYTLSTMGLHPGMYILSVNSPSTRISKMVVVQ
ncbi:MAG: DNRLRE domain-containing protein [Bacteroidetes bacterium]|nr:DNRLRE domain-containing protein [Bacteroidota bacterium]